MTLLSFWSTSASTDMHQPTWLMTAAGSATAGPVLDRRRTTDMMKLDVPPTIERRSATDRLLSMDHASGTVCRRQFATHLTVFTNRFETHLFAFDSYVVCDSKGTSRTVESHRVALETIIAGPYHNLIQYAPRSSGVEGEETWGGLSPYHPTRALGERRKLPHRDPEVPTEMDSWMDI